jgi:hypothetical protein
MSVLATCLGLFILMLAGIHVLAVSGLYHGRRKLPVALLSATKAAMHCPVMWIGPASIGFFVIVQTWQSVLTQTSAVLSTAYQGLPGCKPVQQVPVPTVVGSCKKETIVSVNIYKHRKGSVKISGWKDSQFHYNFRAHHGTCSLSFAKTFLCSA